MRRQLWKILTYNLILQLSNVYEIDPAELLAEYQFNAKEIKNFYKWCNTEFGI